MGGEMVTETWFGSLWWISFKNASETDKAVIGILAFEVASLMLKVVDMWHCLSENEVHRLREEIVNSVGIQKLVADDDDYLMDLAINELVENFGNVAKAVARFGKRCKDPVYHRFENFINDPILNNFEWFGWEYRLKKMERKVKKMERYAAVMMKLCEELEVLAEREQTLRRMKANVADKVRLLEFQQKVTCQRQEVRNLREMSPWVRNYDYIVRLLVRSLFTILERMKHVFGTHQMASMEGNTDCGHRKTDFLTRSHSFSAPIKSSVYFSEKNHCATFSGNLGRSVSKSIQITDKGRSNGKRQQSLHRSDIVNVKLSHSKSKQLGHVRPFGGCMMSGSDSPIYERCKPIGGTSTRFSTVHTKRVEKMEKTDMESLSCDSKVYSKLLIFSSKQGLLNAPPSTLGDAALALHYANIILLIDKLASSPRMIGLDTRDDLYNMLPMTIKTALRVKLKAYAKTWASSAYDASLEAQWNLTMTRILEWLIPLACNMIKWQSERNFEKENVVSRSNVLLVQTLHFANRAKTEALITELLVGLNYLCRICREVNEKALPLLSVHRGSDGCWLKSYNVS